MAPVPVVYKGSSPSVAETVCSQIEREGSLPIVKYICIASDMPKSSCSTPLLLISLLMTDFYFQCPFPRLKK